MESLPWWPGDPESMAEDAENDANSQADSLIGHDATHGLRKSCRKRTYEIMMLESLPRCCYYMAQGKGVFSIHPSASMYPAWKRVFNRLSYCD